MKFEFENSIRKTPTKQLQIQQYVLLFPIKNESNKTKTCNLTEYNKETLSILLEQCVTSCTYHD